jgi:hypothetical protein
MRIHVSPTQILASLVLLAIGSDAHAGGISSADALGDGSLVTINGTGFGTKDNAKPLYFWDFSKSTTRTSPLSRLDYSGTVRGAISPVVVAPGSATALKVDMGGNSDAAGPQDGVPFNSSQVYAWIKHRYEFNIVAASGANGFNLKAFRLWDPFIHDIFVDYQGSNGGTGHVEVEHTQNQNPSIWFGLNPVPKAWMIEEYDYQSSSVGAADGILQYIRNGVAAWTYNSRFAMRDSAYPNPYRVLFFDQVSNNLIAPGTYQYIDSIYVDDSRQRVILSDEPTWKQVTSGQESHREIQIPVTWSDGQIQIIARMGSFDTFAHKYLYVIGTDGQPVSAQGFSVVGGGRANITPNAPSSITVH